MITTYKVVKEKDGRWHGYARHHWWQKYVPVWNVQTDSAVSSEHPDFWTYVLDGTHNIRLIYETEHF